MAPKGLVLLALFTACPVLANTVLSVDSVNTNLGVYNLWIDENNVATEAYWAGAINISVNGQSTIAFCAQLFVDINLGKNYNTVVDYANTASLERVALLLDYHFPTTAITGAGLQLAIWDIMEDGGDGLASGKVQAITATSPLYTGSNLTDASVLAAANVYLGYTTGLTTMAYYYDNTDQSTGAEVQDLISQTPEPSAIVLIFSGLALIGLGRLRRRVTR